MGTRLPAATYRIQFNQQFTFKDAREIVPYLKELGISDLYASPIFQAGPESTHGYDVCGFGEFAPGIGSQVDFEELSDKLKSAGMGLLLDMVPNHMGAHGSNCWWRDVLKNGRESVYSEYFDIDWDSENPSLKGKVLLPVLGDHYNNVLEKGELEIRELDGEFVLAYYDKNFPLSPETQIEIAAAGKTREEALERYKGIPGDSRSWDALHKVIAKQNYRLAFWRVGSEEINYRRFFDVTDLVSLKMEREEVFEAAHQFAFELIRQGRVTGLRIDHPDGLRDPRQYFERLQSKFKALGNSGELYVVAEKILSEGEKLDARWPVAGTTGYDFLAVLTPLFVRQDANNQFAELYRLLTENCAGLAMEIHRCKRRILKASLVSETRSLTRRLKRLSAKTRHGQDFTWSDLRRAIIELIAGLPVYRTYVDQTSKQLTEAEQGWVNEALRRSKERRSPGRHAAFEYVAGLLSLTPQYDLDEKGQAEHREFVQRFQQLSGPATAKGIEDTAFYRYNRLVSLNEVGGNPGEFGISPEQFHEYNQYNQKHWPGTLLATATHDTKRGEDTRARINVLSELGPSWFHLVEGWANLNRGFKIWNGSEGWPGKNDEYLLYQTLAGTWVGEEDPKQYLGRIQAYMSKAAKEAKIHTTWTEPNAAYETALKNFVESVLQSERFRKNLEPFAKKVRHYGYFNSLAQITLKMFSPGVPDFYQGTELWDYSLVDPDNRRPVDYNKRRKLLENVKSRAQLNGYLAELLRELDSGEIKMFTIWKGLQLRGRAREVLEKGSYEPLTVQGEKAGQIVAFQRRFEGKVIAVIVPRLIATLAGWRSDFDWGSLDWKDTTVQLGAGLKLKSLFSGADTDGGTVPASAILKDFPVAVLSNF